MCFLTTALSFKNNSGWAIFIRAGMPRCVQFQTLCGLVLSKRATAEMPPKSKITCLSLILNSLFVLWCILNDTFKQKSSIYVTPFCLDRQKCLLGCAVKPLRVARPLVKLSKMVSCKKIPEFLTRLKNVSKKRGFVNLRFCRNKPPFLGVFLLSVQIIEINYLFKQYVTLFKQIF
mgnify:CR=1 FL=1